MPRKQGRVWSARFPHGKPKVVFVRTTGRFHSRLEQEAQRRRDANPGKLVSMADVVREMLAEALEKPVKEIAPDPKPAARPKPAPGGLAARVFTRNIRQRLNAEVERRSQKMGRQLTAVEVAKALLLEMLSPSRRELMRRAAMTAKLARETALSARARGYVDYARRLEDAAADLAALATPITKEKAA